MLDEEVARGNVGSAIGLISRNGTVLFHESAGEFKEDQPMRTDAIVRFASSGKTFAATATLSLYEQGKLSLGDPVEKFIPAFANVRMGNTGSAPKRSIRIRDLLTHESGLAVDGPEFEAAWLATEGKSTTRDLAERMAAIPLKSEPGSTWNYGSYGSNYEVLAAVLEVASGESLESLFEQVIFGPLGMNDTHFFIPRNKVSRIPAYYQLRDGRLSIVTPAGEESPRSTFLAGGGGVRSTVEDFHLYCLMLLNGGELNGVRILSPKSVDLMMTDHVGAEGMPWGGGEYGWGFGAAVRNRVRDYEIGSVGTYGWNGGSGTAYWIDRQEGMIGIIVAPSAPPAHSEIYDRFEVGMYQAIVNQGMSIERERLPNAPGNNRDAQ